LQQLKKNIYFSFYALMQCTKEDLSDPIKPSRSSHVRLSLRMNAEISESIKARNWHADFRASCAAKFIWAGGTSINGHNAEICLASTFLNILKKSKRGFVLIINTHLHAKKYWNWPLIVKLYANKGIHARWCGCHLGNSRFVLPCTSLSSAAGIW